MLRKLNKVLAAAFAVGLLLSLTAGTAAALRSISINERSIHVIWEAGNELGLGGGILAISCQVTLRIVFSSSAIGKTPNTEVGDVVDARAASCREPFNFGQSATPLINRAGEPETTWKVLFISISGTLPRILKVRLILRRARFLISAAGGSLACLYEGTESGNSPAGEVEVNARGEVTAVRPDNTSRIPLRTRLNGECPAEGNFTRSARRITRLRDGGVVNLILV